MWPYTNFVCALTGVAQLTQTAVKLHVEYKTCGVGWGVGLGVGLGEGIGVGFGVGGGVGFGVNVGHLCPPGQGSRFASVCWGDGQHVNLWVSIYL
jgi:hypothetical protein